MANGKWACFAGAAAHNVAMPQGRTRVLVTGGTGFLGRFLVHRLLRDGADVRVLSRSRGKARRLFGDHVNVVRGDIREPSSLRAACRDVEALYHVAGVYRFGPGNAHRLLRGNLQGTRNVLQAAWNAGVSKVLHVSTASILKAPAGSPRAEIIEDDLIDGPPLLSHYRRSKWLAERCALDWAARGLPVVIASPSCPIGAEDERPTPTGRMILDFLRGNFRFASRTGLNFIAVEDVADGMVAAAERGRAGHRYLLTGRNPWLTEFLQLVGDCARLPAPSRLLPPSLISLGGAIGEVAGRIHPRWGERLCWETAGHSREAQFFDARRTRDELEWEPVRSIENAVGEAVDYFSGRVGERCLAVSDALVS
ncbi:MAG: NAD-dependent epimerase/dehydratase family protein [Verrucomicrobiae bacterium]|nr:NAD-dependent epimerase/dehydratase family protein [Verrucomicrobiae bacterium]